MKARRRSNATARPTDSLPGGSKVRTRSRTHELPAAPQNERAMEESGSRIEKQAAAGTMAAKEHGPMPSDRAPLVEVENLRVRFATDDGVIDAVSDVSFTIPQSGAVGLVGESGCGKSMTGLSLLQLVPPPGRIDGGAIRYHRIAHAGAPCKVVDIAALPPRGDTVRSIRGAEIAMIFQEPMSSLNPVYTIGSQIAEMVRTHEEASAREARARAIEMLRRVGIPDPEQRVDAYPHQLSGGMRQRAMIAMALVD